MTEVILFLLLLAGTVCLFWETLAEIALRLRQCVGNWYNSLKRAELPAFAEQTKRGTDGCLTHHFKLLLQLTLGIGSEKGLRVFGAFCGCCGGLVILLLGHRVSMRLALSAALLAMMFPYAGLQLMLQQKRNAASREGEALLTELLENYKICQFHMREAIELTAQTMEEAPNVRRLLFSLSKGLNRGLDDAQTREMLEEFRLSIHTSWANILTANLRFALLSSAEITEALQDLTETMVQARKVDEYAKRENQEAGMMLRWLAPVCYLLTVIGGIFWFRLSPGQFLHYQFATRTGLTWLVISGMLYGSGLLLYGFLRRGRLDL